MLMRRNLLTRLWHWITDQIIQDVRMDSALCEFDCRKRQCLSGEWETCERRLAKAAGELMPAKRDPAGETS